MSNWPWNIIAVPGGVQGYITARRSLKQPSHKTNTCPSVTDVDVFNGGWVGLFFLAISSPSSQSVSHLLNSFLLCPWRCWQTLTEADTHSHSLGTHGGARLDSFRSFYFFSPKQKDKVAPAWRSERPRVMTTGWWEATVSCLFSN